MIYGNKFLNEGFEMGIQNLHKKVYLLLKDIVPKEFQKIYFYAIYSEGSFEMNFYTYIDGHYIDAYHIGVNKPKIVSTFLKIDKLIKEIDFPVQRPTVITLEINGDGRTRSSYEYDDHSKDMIGYVKDWKNKYLI